MAHPPVVIVDKDDTVVGEAALDEARARGLIYRVVFVVAKRPDGSVLLQKRAPTMQVYPDCWDVSASGHVDDGHGYEEAAHLELEEEIGVHGAQLHEIAHFYTEEPLWGGIASRRYAKIYEITLVELPKHLGGDEVTRVRWFTPDEIRRLAAEHPERVAEGLHHFVERILGEA